MPEPQVTGQAVQVVQLPYVQSHSPSSQGAESSRLGQDVPQISALLPSQVKPSCGVCISLVRVRVPDLHVTEQEVHAAQSSTLQSTGHVKALQALLSLEVGQAAPPCAAGVVIVRVRS